VAEPCKEIAANKEDVYKYTAKGNLVGVISNGTAVLGLGDIGPRLENPLWKARVFCSKYLLISTFSTSRSTKKIRKICTDS
jgi:malate dehydrogenase (oxaloacetate-decarboxylating)(NADP+)